MQQESYCGGQRRKERAELLPAAQQREQLNFPAPASGSAVEFHLLNHFCHIRSLPSPTLTLAMGTPRALNPGQGGLGPSLLALCQE